MADSNPKGLHPPVGGLHPSDARTNRKLNYIYASDGLFAIYVMNGENDTMYYIHKDYLGSYDVITDEAGNVLERMSFDPWGRRRNPTDWTYNNMPKSFLFDRGYTGHEHLDVFSLINMNGRVYDPWLGRFLSPDPIVQSPGYSQSYNRYSYCFNNPLRLVDPSGYNAWKLEENPIQTFGSNNPSIFRISWNVNPYRYDWNTGQYFNSNGQEVTYDEVFNNYIQPNQVNTTSNISISFTLESTRYTPILTNKKIPDTPEWKMDDGSIWYVYGYKTIITKEVIEFTARQGANFDNSSLALDIGGGIYRGLRTAVTPGDQWLGKNGKYYNNSWGGNRYTGSRSGAFAASNTYKWAGRATVGASAVIGGIQVYNGYQMDGGQFGYNANVAGASATGSIVGGWAGAEAGATVGAAIGVWFGGVGAVPGAIIGGFFGGIAGSLTGNKVGEMIVNYYYGR